MKLATFSPKGGWEDRTGVIVGGNVVDLNAAYCQYLAESEGRPRAAPIADALMPADMLGFLDGGESSLARARSMVDYVSQRDDRLRITDTLGRRLLYGMKDVQLKSPIPRPRGLGIGFFNDRGIIEEASRLSTQDGNEGIKTSLEYPKQATISWAHPSCVIGPEEGIVHPKMSKEVFNGIELGLVIGREAYQVPLGEAKGYIIGYTVTSDVTAYDLVQEEPFVYTITRCKDMPTFWPVGPWIATSDEVGDVADLKLTVRVNEKEIMTANTRSHIYSPYDYVHDVSQYMLLEPGTIIAMGSFVGATTCFIKPGDVVENEIERIGILRNPVRAE